MVLEEALNNKLHGYVCVLEMSLTAQQLIPFSCGKALLKFRMWFLNCQISKANGHYCKWWSLYNIANEFCCTNRGQQTIHTRCLIYTIYMVLNTTWGYLSCHGLVIIICCLEHLIAFIKVYFGNVLGPNMQCQARINLVCLGVTSHSTIFQSYRDSFWLQQGAQCSLL